MAYFQSRQRGGVMSAEFQLVICLLLSTINSIRCSKVVDEVDEQFNLQYGGYIDQEVEIRVFKCNLVEWQKLEPSFKVIVSDAINAYCSQTPLACCVRMWDNNTSISPPMITMSPGSPNEVYVYTTIKFVIIYNINSVGYFLQSRQCDFRPRIFRKGIVSELLNNQTVLSRLRASNIVLDSELTAKKGSFQAFCDIALVPIGLSLLILLCLGKRVAVHFQQKMDRQNYAKRHMRKINLQRSAREKYESDLNALYNVSQHQEGEKQQQIFTVTTGNPNLDQLTGNALANDVSSKGYLAKITPDELVSRNTTDREATAGTNRSRVVNSLGKTTLINHFVKKHRQADDSRNPILEAGDGNSEINSIEESFDVVASSENTTNNVDNNNITKQQQGEEESAQQQQNDTTATSYFATSLPVSTVMKNKQQKHQTIPQPNIPAT